MTNLERTGFSETGDFSSDGDFNSDGVDHEMLKAAVRQAIEKRVNGIQRSETLFVSILLSEGGICVRLYGMIGSAYRKQLAQEAVRPNLPVGYTLVNDLVVPPLCRPPRILSQTRELD